jgi:hypothetical protein
MHWERDPTEHALEASTWRSLDDSRSGPANASPPLCNELGRRLLIAHLEASEWVLRRVERVSFDGDRGVHRQITVELLVPDGAPEFVDNAGNRFWLLPLSVMWRRTLVNLELKDEHGQNISTAAVRLAEELDESMLLAAVASCDARATSQVQSLVRKLVEGRRREVDECEEDVEDPTTDLLANLSRCSLFMWAFRRLQRGSSLYTFLPVSSGRHRRLQMSFEEPTNWRYQKPLLERPNAESEDPECRYETDNPDLSRVDLAARLGWRPTRIRFQVPSAELAAGYQFEVTAPDGVQVEKATLLAGRLNDPSRHVSVDHVEGHAPTVALRAYEIPNGSNCRVQLDIGIPTRGFLNTAFVSSWVIFIVLVLAGIPWVFRDVPWSPDQMTNMVLVLITVAAGVATLISQRETGEVAARLVSRLRAMGAVAVTLPVAMAGTLVFLIPSTGRDARPRWAEFLVASTAVAAFAIAVLVTKAWRRSMRIERKKVVEGSPLDRTTRTHVDNPPADYWLAVDKYGFDSPAIGIRSAEAWHERYFWTDPKQRDAIVALKPTVTPQGSDGCTPFCVGADARCLGSIGCRALAAPVETIAPGNHALSGGVPSARTLLPMKEPMKEMAHSGSHHWDMMSLTRRWGARPSSSPGTASSGRVPGRPSSPVRLPGDGRRA